MIWPPIVAWLGLLAWIWFVVWLQLYVQKCTRCWKWFTRSPKSTLPSFRCDSCLIVEELTR